MQQAGLFRSVGWMALAALLWACAPGEEVRDGDPAGAGSVRLSFEDALVPAAFSREGLAVADAPGGAAGFWAVVPGLPRPERAQVVNLSTGAEATVALYTGGAGSIRLSGAAAEALGIATTPTRVRVTAVRREPRIAPP